MILIDALSDTPRTKRALAERLGVSTREVEAEVQAARLRGVPIVSSADGYRISQDPAEIKACADRLRQRALTQLETARAMRRTAARLNDRDRLLTLWTDAA